MEIIILMAIFGGLGQFMGRRKGYPWAGLVLGGLLSLVGIIIILVMPDRTLHAQGQPPLAVTRKPTGTIAAYRERHAPPQPTYEENAAALRNRQQH